MQAFVGGPAFIYTALIFQRVVKFTGPAALFLNASLLAIYIVVALILQFTVLDRWGRKPVAATACLVGAVGAFITAFLAGSGIPLVIAFTLFALGSQMSVLPFWPWSVEQLPTHLRATGQSIGSAGGKLGLCMGALIFSPGVMQAIGWQPYFLFVGVVFLGLVAFVILVGKETRGTVLHE